jgi:hypothetical protein
MDTNGDSRGNNMLFFFYIIYSDFFESIFFRINHKEGLGEGK